MRIDQNEQCWCRRDQRFNSLAIYSDDGDVMGDGGRGKCNGFVLYEFAEKEYRYFVCEMQFHFVLDIRNTMKIEIGEDRRRTLSMYFLF